MLFTLRLIYLPGALNSHRMLFFSVGIVFFSSKFHHSYIVQRQKKNYIFEKINDFNNLDIYAVVTYFIVHFNA